jgi:hypothetical protein
MDVLRCLVCRFERILEASGINEALRKAGITEGDTVVLGDQGEFVWSDDRWVTGPRERLHQAYCEHGRSCNLYPAIHPCW